jgi:hypothetical protein
MDADPSGRAVYGLGLWPLACRNFGFESRRGHGSVSLMIVVCCQVQVGLVARPEEVYRMSCV